MQQSKSDALLLRYQTLLAMADLLAHAGSLDDLFRHIAERLRQVVASQFLNLSVHDPSRNVMRLEIWEGMAGPALPFEVPVKDTLLGWVWEHQQPSVCSVEEQDQRFPCIDASLREQGIRSYCVLPLSFGEKRIGALGFGSSDGSAYGPEDLDFLQRMAELMALAVHNAHTRVALQKETGRLRALVDVNHALAARLDVRELVPGISSSIHGVVKHEYLSLATNENSGTHALRLYELVPQASPQLVAHDLPIPIAELPAGRALREGQVRCFNRSELEA